VLHPAVRVSGGEAAAPFDKGGVPGLSSVSWSSRRAAKTRLPCRLQRLRMKS